MSSITSGDYFKEITRGALVNLANAGGLDPNATYAITDFPAPQCLAGKIEAVYINATDAFRVANDVDVKTTYDTTAWEGQVDVVSGTWLKLDDFRGNSIRDHANIYQFNWGNPLYVGNKVDSGGRWVNTCDDTVAKYRVHVGTRGYLDTSNSTVYMDAVEIDSYAYVQLNGAGGGTFAQIQFTTVASGEGLSLAEEVISPCLTPRSPTTRG